MQQGAVKKSETMLDFSNIKDLIRGTGYTGVGRLRRAGNLTCRAVETNLKKSSEGSWLDLW